MWDPDHNSDKHMSQHQGDMVKPEWGMEVRGGEMMAVNMVIRKNLPEEELVLEGAEWGVVDWFRDSEKSALGRENPGKVLDMGSIAYLRELWHSSRQGWGWGSRWDRVSHDCCLRDTLVLLLKEDEAEAWEAGQFTYKHFILGQDQDRMEDREGFFLGNKIRGDGGPRLGGSSENVKATRW